MAIAKLPKNDGWTKIEYDLGPEAEENARISYILNEACHVFRHHPSGTWASGDKDAYASMLIPELERRPTIVGRLLKTEDRVVKMITYRALEIIDARKKAAP